MSLDIYSQPPSCCRELVGVDTQKPCDFCQGARVRMASMRPVGFHANFMPSHPIFETENPQDFWLTGCEILGDGMLKTVIVSLLLNPAARSYVGVVDLCSSSLILLEKSSVSLRLLIAG
jgi:hypothetical protein